MKKFLQKTVAEIILQHLKAHKGLESQISKMAGINCKKFTLENFVHIQAKTLLSIMYGIAACDSKDFKVMINEISDVIDEYQDIHDMELLLER